MGCNRAQHNIKVFVTKTMSSNGQVTSKRYGRAQHNSTTLCQKDDAAEKLMNPKRVEIKKMNPEINEFQNVSNLARKAACIAVGSTVGTKENHPGRGQRTYKMGWTV